MSRKSPRLSVNATEKPKKFSNYFQTQGYGTPIAEGMAGQRRKAAEVMSGWSAQAARGGSGPSGARFVPGSGWVCGSHAELLGIAGNSLLPQSWWVPARETRPGPLGAAGLGWRPEGLQGTVAPSPGSLWTQPGPWPLALARRS